ncbi:hypothetical protein BaRGS_00024693 [Batillaria attramentaria]|uniref:Uncharacterized protein n=1 Tax=Batillaria attramentaria TaxID=370345 RepID=A0ABD0KAF0_9CAEN
MFPDWSRVAWTPIPSPSFPRHNVDPFYLCTSKEAARQISLGEILTNNSCRLALSDVTITSDNASVKAIDWLKGQVDGKLANHNVQVKAAKKLEALLVHQHDAERVWKFEHF